MFSQQPDQKNLLAAIVLSMGVLLLWQYFYAGPKLKEEQERQKILQKTAAAQQQAPGVPTTPALPGAPAAPTTPGAPQPTAPGVTAAGVPAAALTRPAALEASPRITIETPSLQGSVSLRGARLDDITLVKHRQTVDPKSGNVLLFSPSGGPEPFYTESGWVPGAGSTQRMPDRETVWTAESKGPLTPSSPVTLSWNNGQGLLFRRTIKVDDNYLFSISDEVENRTGAEITLFPYALISRHGTPKVDGNYILHEGVIAVLGEKGLTEIAYSELSGDIDKNVKRNPQNTSAIREHKALKSGWIGITDKYWAAALIPSQTTEYDARLWAWRQEGKVHYQVDYRQPGVTIAAGAKGVSESMLFAGAKEVRIVDGYKAQYGIKQFDLIIDWGWFWYITKPLFHILDWINKIVKNFGLAILIVTVLVKLVFFPLANKSYDSMAKMKKLQPEMEKIRERHKDDKARQQQEMMALYQKEKINPLAGCLPILVQIPVFFALYKVLFVSLDMRHAPFFGWIKDLSAPDPTSLFNLFGLLPIPAVDGLLLGYTIGAWAVLMGFTMWLQMQLNPQQPDPMQQAIFNWMPVMFTVMLGGFSSGLVIYWAWSNILSIIQQYYIMRRNNVDVPLMDNIRKTFGPVANFMQRKK